MITAPSSKWVTLISMVFLLVILWSPRFTNGQDAPDQMLEAFEQTYNEISAQVKKGKLKPEVGAKANELKLALKKYLIKADAQLEILQLDVLHGSEGRREASLTKMMAISAERERIKMGYLQRLQGLKAGKSGGKGDMLLLPVVPEQSKAAPEKDEAATETVVIDETNKKWSWKDIKIEIGPDKLDQGLE